MNRAILSVLACLAFACQPSLGVRWADLQRMEPPARSDYPDHGAVVLLEAVTGLNVGSTKGWYQEWLRHSVVAILDERGLDEGTLRCHRTPGAELRAFHARVRTPDGRVREVADDDLHTHETRRAANDETGEMRTLVVPGVEVGSVVEVVCLEHADGGIFLSEFFRPRSDLPVARYEVTLKTSDTLRADLRGYNTQQPIVRTEQGGLVTYQWAVENVPALVSEPWAVHWTERTPWWVYRTLSYQDGSSYWPFVKGWPDVVRALAVRLDADDHPVAEGGPRPPSTSHCGADRACVIEALYAATQRQAELRWPDFPFNPRPLSEAYGAGRVTPTERAVLLVSWLRQAGFDARHALLPSRFAFRVDREFPSHHPFDTMVAYLPADPAHGRPKALWLDPRCEPCGAGALSPLAVGTDALVIKATAQMVTKPEIAAEWVPVFGSVPDPGRIVRSIGVRLDASGDATVDVAEQREAMQAEWRWHDMRDRSNARVKSDAVARARRHDLRARLKTHTRAVYERDQHRLTESFQYSVKALAARSDDLLVMPLTMLEVTHSSGWSEDARRMDFVVGAPLVEAEHIVVTPPPGYVLRSLPAEVEATSSMVGMTFEARRDDSGRALLTRRLTVRAGRFPSSEGDVHRAVHDRNMALRRAVVVFARAAE